MTRMCRKPNPGFDWNPLPSRMERNGPCLCGSGAKWKKCCINRLPEIVPESTAKKIREAKTLEEAIEIHDQGVEVMNEVFAEREKGKDDAAASPM
jgi:hypothetical protein